MRAFSAVLIVLETAVEIEGCSTAYRRNIRIMINKYLPRMNPVLGTVYADGNIDALISLNADWAASNIDEDRNFLEKLVRIHHPPFMCIGKEDIWGGGWVGLIGSGISEHIGLGSTIGLYIFNSE